uniref:Transposase n=1 Tax=Mesocestoides corti TaxID=53468 RepID=A0A5K3G216_MESCO
MRRHADPTTPWPEDVGREDAGAGWLRFEPPDPRSRVQCDQKDTSRPSRPSQEVTAKEGIHRLAAAAAEINRYLGYHMNFRHRLRVNHEAALQQLRRRLGSPIHAHTRPNPRDEIPSQHT